MNNQNNASRREHVSDLPWSDNFLVLYSTIVRKSLTCDSKFRFLNVMPSKRHCSDSAIGPISNSTGWIAGVVGDRHRMV